MFGLQSCYDNWCWTESGVYSAVVLQGDLLWFCQLQLLEAHMEVLGSQEGEIILAGSHEPLLHCAASFSPGPTSWSIVHDLWPNLGDNAAPLVWREVLSWTHAPFCDPIPGEALIDWWHTAKLKRPQEWRKGLARVVFLTSWMQAPERMHL